MNLKNQDLKKYFWKIWDLEQKQPGLLQYFIWYRKCFFVTINREYNSAKDIRKNLIERSHLSYDSKFFIPRWYFINSKIDFLNEAKNYQYYRNFKRFHSWRFMNNLTPIQKAKKLWIYNIDIMNIFPTVILQDHFNVFHNIKKSQYVLTYDLFNFLRYKNTTFKSSVFSFIVLFFP